MYQDPLLMKLIEKLNAHGPARLKNRYFIGDPVMVAESMLPICFITKDTATVSNESFGDDRTTTAVVLNVVNRFTHELNQKAFVHAGTSDLYDLCEGRNADYTLKEGTVAYVLRADRTLEADANAFIDVENDLVIDYAISPPSRRGMFSAEAMIRTNLVTVTDSPSIAS